ncbi:MAG: hypothetical protein OEQ39_26645, partial [Gammaproteobacteria bacterium]|nr:hypothetical protein [Gammaproteobacteria bacterium]
MPTEITSSYAPAGDDSGGWLWKEQKYDWNGRVVEKINTDGTNRLISYSGCGCAGGQIATLKGEEVPRDDQPTTNARRTTKVYTDILGRSYKTEILAWDGTTVYKSTVKTFNGRNQVVEIKETDHERDPNVDQISTITYDGHGRPKTRHNPIEDSSAYTKLFYNDDDSINYSIDPRQVITNFTYNDPRGLLTKITYQRPAGSENTIPLTPDVEIDYDSLGNRTTLDDGSGSTSYSYDELSRLTSETKTFSGLSGSFTLSYSYHINGKLKSVTDPFGAVVNYNDDEVGRTTSITGSGYQSVSTYASNIKHRAFGGIKELDYGSGDNSEVSYEYDTRLRVSDYSATSNVLSGGFVRKAAYDYFDDNRVEVAHNLVNDSFDQTFAYDQMGRTTKNEFGTAIDDDEEEVTTYSQSLQYDGFSQITSRITNVWGGGDGFTATYANGRKQNSNWLYDAAGNFIDNTTSPTVYDRNGYDEAGNQTETIQRYYQGAPQQTSFDRTVEIENSFDGDERLVKRIETNTSQQVWPPNLPPNITSKTEY